MVKIGFIGAGRMAQALSRRFKAENIIASSPRIHEKLLDECKTLGIATTSDNTEVVSKSDVVIIAVKPPQVSKIVSEIARVFKRDHQLLVSIALGITIRNIETLLPPKSRVVRVMPNTPVVVGAGASAFAVGSACQDGDSTLVQDLFSTVGFAVEVPEAHIDPVTGLSGSGPAYMFSAIEGLADGGVKMGLPRDLSLKLAAHTLLGAAKMALDLNEHPAVLKDNVQSPGGSSAYGTHELEKGGFKAILISAVEAASNRSKTTGVAVFPRNSLYRDTEL
ncbi:hypothetical protein QR680_011311 [Steinernema hermaphroditum]|uniref:Pyrroline-5-carboxylate reductase n=1 Tax=Steinernema hermaphroditum TaxID=289476 RepID=A0AA39IT93_9BILA|nr:hypothetical protein QR680_011311 [Steinernema hermaphroditum]